MAACGLLTPRLDHNKRAVEFARRLIAIGRRFAQEFNKPIKLSVGIHSGTVLAVLSAKNILFMISGEQR